MCNQLRSIKYLLVTCLGLVLVLVSLAPRASSNGSNAPPKVKVLVKGAPIHLANGINFDAQNRLYVGSVAARGFYVLDPESGQVLDFFGPARGVEGADDLIIGPDGAVYYTAILTGEVGRVLPDGTKETVAQLPPGVNPITFSDDGRRLFVALAFLGDALFEVYLDGRPPRLIAQNLGWLNGMDWGPDGYLYGPLIQSRQVVKIHPDTGAVIPIASGFTFPSAVKFGPDGGLYVVDAYRVLRLDVDTGDAVEIATTEPGLDNLAFDNRGWLYVSNNDLGWVARVLPNGKVHKIIPGGMTTPGGVAVLPAQDKFERVFVGNTFTLHEYDGQTGQPLSRAHGFADMMTVAPDGDHLVISSWFTNVVQVWDPQTQQVLEAHHDFAVPLNAIRFQGDLVVAELLTGQVVRRNSATGERTPLATLAVPAGLAATDDDLWVSDWFLGMVWQIVADGNPVLVPVASGLSFPEGLAVDADGHLLVVEAGAGRLSRINPATGIVTPLVEGLALGGFGPPTMPPTWLFNGVAVGPSGAIYVTGDKANVLYRIAVR